jgi:integrase
LIATYQAGPEWAALAESTRSDWSRYLAYLKSVWAERRVEALEPKHVLALRDVYADMPPAAPTLPTKPVDEYADRPAAANNLLRCFSAMLAWSIPRGWRADNPCDHVPKFKSGDGYAPWGWDDIELFRRHAAKRFLIAQALALYTGQRLGDVLAMPRTDVKAGMIAVIQEKTGTKLWIPMHRDLKPMLTNLEQDSVTILVNSDGLPWTKDGFKASWNKQMNVSELGPLRARRLVFHGLRKSAVVFLLEAG